jgi:hypothetical protein
MSFPSCCLYLIPCDVECTNTYANDWYTVSFINCDGIDTCDDIEPGLVLKLNDGCCYTVDDVDLNEENCTPPSAGFVDCFKSCAACLNPPITLTPTPTNTVTPTLTPTLTPTPNPGYLVDLQDCCTLDILVSKYDISSATTPVLGDIIYIDIGFGEKCYNILSIEEGGTAIYPVITIYTDCDECITNTQECPTPTPTVTPTITPTQTKTPTLTPNPKYTVTITDCCTLEQVGTYDISSAF